MVLTVAQQATRKGGGGGGGHKRPMQHIKSITIKVFAWAVTSQTACDCWVASSFCLAITAEEFDSLATFSEFRARLYKMLQ